MSIRRSRDFLARCGVALVLVLAATLVAGPSSGQIPEKALECNSGIAITIGAQTPVAGGNECEVTLDISNGLSRDALNNNVAQDFSEIQFFPSCTSTPCMPDPALPVTYVVGSATTDCGQPLGPPPAMPVVNPAPPADVSFQFPFTLGPSMTGTCPAGDPCRCQISFRVFTPDTAGLGPFPIEAVIPSGNPGVCQVSLLTSSSSAVDSITKVPTLGAWALLVLALALLGGAWRVLRRTPVSPPLAGA